MKASSELYILIQSLTGPEKRYFRLTNQNTADKTAIYIQLFDLLEAQKTYDESRLPAVFQQQIRNKKFHVTKKYLYEKLLDALRQFNEKNSIDIQIQNGISNASILENRGLYKQAEKVLREAKKLALKYHKTLYLLEIIAKELRLLQFNTQKIQSAVEAKIQELNTWIDKCHYEYEAYGFRSSVFTLNRTKNHLAPQEQATILQQYENSKFLQLPTPEAATFYAKSYKLLSRVAFRALQKQDQETIAIYEELLALWNKEPHLQKEKPHFYIIHLANYLNYCFKAQKLDGFEETLEKMRKIEASTKHFDHRAEVFQNVYFFELLYRLNTFDWVKAEALVPTIQKKLSQFKPKVNTARELAFYYNITILYFIQAKWETALRWLEEIIHHPTTEHRQDYQQFARILHLILLFELNNSRYLESLFDSTYRKLTRANKLVKFEKIVFKYIKNIIYAANKTMQFDNFLGFKKELNQLSATEKNWLGFEEISTWVQSKTSQQSMLEILKENAATKSE